MATNWKPEFGEEITERVVTPTTNMPSPGTKVRITIPDERGESVIYGTVKKPTSESSYVYVEFGWAQSLFVWLNEDGIRHGATVEILDGEDD